MPLSGEQWERLNNFFANHFNNITLAQMLQFRLNKKLANITLPVPGVAMPQIAFDVINTAEMEGWTADLIAAAQDFRPNNNDLAALAEELGIVGTGQSRSALESVVKKSSKFVDVDRFYQAYGVRRGQVCRIEYSFPGGIEYGTGFLVGPDLVMTARHVIAHAIESKLNGDDLICRFDYKTLPNGKNLDGTIYHLRREGWVVAERRHSRSDETGSGEPMADELDYAVLRLDKPAGQDVIGRGNATGSSGAQADPDAAKRGWIKISPPLPAAAHLNLLVLQHPDKKPMQLAIGEIEEVKWKGIRVRHNASTLPGSSGSPCFNPDLDVVAFHHAGDPLYDIFRGRYNQAIPMAPIIADLQARGVEPFWENEPPAPPAEA